MKKIILIAFVAMSFNTFAFDEEVNTSFHTCSIEEERGNNYRTGGLFGTLGNYTTYQFSVKGINYIKDGSDNIRVQKITLFHTPFDEDSSKGDAKRALKRLIKQGICPQE